MDQSPAPVPRRLTLGTLSPRMTAFVLADAALFVAFLVVLVLFLSGSIGGSASSGDTPSPATSRAGGTTGSSPSPSGTSTGEAATTFALPSGNIACEITSDAATCTIASSKATPPADPKCKGVLGLVLKVTAKGATMPCVEGDPPGVAVEGTPTLEYGQSKTSGDFTCTSSSTGVTCRHDPSGKGFQLARAGSKLF